VAASFARLPLRGGSWSGLGGRAKCHFPGPVLQIRGRGGNDGAISKSVLADTPIHPKRHSNSILHSCVGTKSGNVYLEKLHQICATTLANDYWEITLPNRLATSASRSPSRFAYQASLILLGARALYSPLKIADMVDPAVKGSKTAV
jgi:hypothetical protein